jgi:hypothetical protein
MGQESVGEGGDGALCERLARTRKALERERQQAPELLAELFAEPGGSPSGRIAIDPRFQTWGLAELLLDRGMTLGLAGDPAAGRYTELALEVAAHLPPHHPPALVQDLKARAWAQTGEARLAAGDTAGAAEALSAAAAALGHGTGDPLVDARLLEFEAAVRAAQGQPGEALALLKQAAARYRRLNEVGQLARVLVRRDELQAEARRGDAVPHFAFEPIG